MSIEHVRMRFAFLVIALAAGCGERRNPEKCLDGHCPDPALPFCDEGGEIGGEPGACVAVECMPGEFGACRGDRALMCNNTGDNFDLVECTYGCSEAAGGCNDCNTPDCERQIIPRYLPTVCNQVATEAVLDINASATLDTSFDLNCTDIVVQVDGPEICILHFGSITIDPNQTLAVIGTRAIALVADQVLDVGGVLDISADAEKNGPGGGTLRSGTNGLVPNAGGGAGYKTQGGSGGRSGSSPSDGGAFNGGNSAVSPATITQLLGGRRTQDGTIEMGISGGGGGAATLISCRDKVDVSGIIDAGGGGGHGSYYPNGDLSLIAMAGGGGSGGTVVLQGMTVRVTGQLFANGGAGGGGNGFPASNPGADGTRSTSPALGGVGMGGGGIGGVGGSVAGLPGLGKAPTSNPEVSVAGGGGSSVGFLLTYTPQGVTPTLMPQAVSPMLEPNDTVATNR